MKMKWVVAIAVVTFTAIFISGPYRTMNSIKSGIETGDQDSLSEDIDFSSVRQSLKDQFNAVMAKSVGENLDDNPFGALAMGFASTMVDGMVDSFITPAGLAKIASNSGADNGVHDSGDGKDNGGRKEPFEGAEYSWESLSKFVVTLPDESGDPTKSSKMILKREGLTWRLVNILLPLDDIPNAKG